MFFCECMAFHVSQRGEQREFYVLMYFCTASNKPVTFPAPARPAFTVTAKGGGGWEGMELKGVEEGGFLS